MELNSFQKGQKISKVLEDYLAQVAKTGSTHFPWPKIRPLIKVKMEEVLEDFHESSPTQDLPAVPNVDPFSYTATKAKCLERLDAFSGIPFTVQRIAELLISPKKHYKRTDKFLRALEKVCLVVSVVEPNKPNWAEEQNEDEDEEEEEELEQELVVNGHVNVNGSSSQIEDELETELTTTSTTDNNRHVEEDQMDNETTTTTAPDDNDPEQKPVKDEEQAEDDDDEVSDAKRPKLDEHDEDEKMEQISSSSSTLNSSSPKEEQQQPVEEAEEPQPDQRIKDDVEEEPMDHEGERLKYWREIRCIIRCTLICLVTEAPTTSTAQSQDEEDKVLVAEDKTEDEASPVAEVLPKSDGGEPQQVDDVNNSSQRQQDEQEQQPSSTEAGVEENPEISVG